MAQSTSPSTSTTPLAGPPTSSTQSTWAVPVRLFTAFLAVVVALLAGFLAGRAYERTTRYDVYWLLGATIDGDLDGPYLDVVYPGGPASQAGLAHGDHIGAIDGRPVTTADQARRMLAEYEPGDTVQLTIRRDGLVEQVPVMLGFIVVVRPEPVDPTIVIAPVEPPAPPPVPNTYREGRLGVYYQMLEPGDPLGDHGALVMMVWAGSPAEREGLMVGDIILQVEGTDLTQRYTLEDALSRYSSGENISLRVRTADGHSRTIHLVLS